MRESKKTCEVLGVEIQLRIRRKKKLPGEEAASASLTTEEDIKKDLYECFDILVVELDARFDAALHLHTIFADLSPKALSEDTEEELKTKYEPLNQAYTGDLNFEKLPYEVLRLRDFITAASELDGGFECDIRKAPGIEWPQWICQWKLQEAVPNLIMAFSLFLTLTISVSVSVYLGTTILVLLGLTSLTKIEQRWLSTPVAGALVTNKSNMGQAGPTAVAAVKGLAWLRCSC